MKHANYLALLGLLAACFSEPATSEAADPVKTGRDGGAGGKPRDGGSKDSGSMRDAGSAEESVPADGATPEDSSADPTAPRDLSAEQQSGTRIKARYYVTDDGARELIGFQDTLRNTECTFEVASDGTVRCLPPGSGATSFSDTACQQPITSIPSGVCNLPAIMYVKDVSTCPARRLVYERGTELKGADGGVAPYYYRSGSECSGPYPSQASYKVYARGKELLPTSFVEATEVEEELGADYRVVQYRGADGSRAIARIEDKAGNYPCNFQLAADSTYRCLPRVNAVASATTFVDDRCSTRAASNPEPACSPKFAIQNSSAGCAPTVSVFTVKRSGTLAWNELSGSCAPTTPASNMSVFEAVGSEVAPESLKAMKIVDGASFGRLRERLFELAPGVRSFHQWLDTETNDACVFIPAADGELRCLPLAVAPGLITGYYSDASCTKRVATSTTTCPPKYAISSDTKVCPNRRQLYGVSGSYTGAVYTKSDSCKATTLPAGTMAWTVGAELDAKTFVQARELIE